MVNWITPFVLTGITFGIGLFTAFMLAQVRENNLIKLSQLKIDSFSFLLNSDLVLFYHFEIYTGLFTRGVLLNFYFAATNNTNGSNY
jgi:hypothetical protein